jgi:hypothetical protein
MIALTSSTAAARSSPRAAPLYPSDAAAVMRPVSDRLKETS